MISMDNEKGLTGNALCGFFALYTKPTNSVFHSGLEIKLCNEVILHHTPTASVITLISD